MVVRKKNLLDAFRRAAPDGRQATPEISRSSNPAGPFAQARGKEREEPIEAEVESRPESEFTFDPASRAEEDRRPALARLVSDPGFRLVVLVAALIAAGAYVAGRFGAKSAQASESAPPVAVDGSAQGVLAAGAAGCDAV